jgi:hypothetical protein
VESIPWNRFLGSLNVYKYGLCKFCTFLVLHSFGKGSEFDQKLRCGLNEQNTSNKIKENLPVWEPRLPAAELPPPKNKNSKLSRNQREKKNLLYFYT